MRVRDRVRVRVSPLMPVRPRGFIGKPLALKSSGDLVRVGVGLGLGLGSG